MFIGGCVKRNYAPDKMTERNISRTCSYLFTNNYSCASLQL